MNIPLIIACFSISLIVSMFTFMRINRRKKNSAQNIIGYSQLIKDHHTNVDIRFKNGRERVEKYTLGPLFEKDVSDHILLSKVHEDFMNYRHNNPDNIHTKNVANFLEDCVLKHGLDGEYTTISRKLLAH